jgi:tRNA threonylcarbamoyladenosine biosynthesis protein TsaE
MLDFFSHSDAQTIRIGQRLGEHVEPGDVLLLIGQFGVGKTQLVKGIVQGLNSPDLVTSPSFVIINEYQSNNQRPALHIYHIDLYRIEDPAELATIGLDEILNQQNICLIEWAERAADWLPGEHLTIYMKHLDETKRVLRFDPHGERYKHLVETFKSKAFG